MALDTKPQPQPAEPTPGVPRHVAITMDGNGRWAEQRGLPRLAGHRAGTENVRRVLRSLSGHGVSYVTMFAFSTENWGRPEPEVNGLIAILDEVILAEAQALHEENVRILHLGSQERLPGSISKAIGDALELTKANTGLTLSVGFDYGGRSEIVEAVRHLLADGVSPKDVTEETLGRSLYLPEVPDPDLIVRTGGDQRLSNFLIWQAAYAELYFTPTLWPDFDDAEVEQAMEAFRGRQRRFGKLPGA